MSTESGGRHWHMCPTCYLYACYEPTCEYDAMEFRGVDRECADCKKDQRVREALARGPQRREVATVSCVPEVLPPETEREWAEQWALKHGNYPCIMTPVELEPVHVEIDATPVRRR